MTLRGLLEWCHIVEPEPEPELPKLDPDACPGCGLRGVYVGTHNSEPDAPDWLCVSEKDCGMYRALQDD